MDPLPKASIGNHRNRAPTLQQRKHEHAKLVVSNHQVISNKEVRGDHAARSGQLPTAFLDPPHHHAMPDFRVNARFEIAAADGRDSQPSGDSKPDRSGLKETRLTRENDLGLKG